jgi:alanyl-tRNA synthetase
MERRRDIARNHTATHLLQYALRRVLGEQVQQRGSLVAPERFRFDFSHLEAMTGDELRQVQRIVNERIRENHPVYDEEMTHQQAVAGGAIALFDEKYGDIVRVLEIGQPAFSAELCGGTHVTSTGEIGYFHIISESSIGAGLRRIEAVTGRGAEAFLDLRLLDIQRAAAQLGVEPDKLTDKVQGLMDELDGERKKARALERELGRITADNLASQLKTVKDINIIVSRVPSASIEVLREISDRIRDNIQSGIIVLGSVYDGKPVFIAAVTPDLVEKGYNAGKLVGQVAKVTGGGGGGKPTLAQAGGRDKGKLDEALRLVEGLI